MKVSFFIASFIYSPDIESSWKYDGSIEKSLFIFIYIFEDFIK